MTRRQVVDRAMREQQPAEPKRRGNAARTLEERVESAWSHVPQLRTPRNTQLADELMAKMPRVRHA